MAAQRPPGIAPPAETLDDGDLIEIDETAPPQRSPLRGALPFGGSGQGPVFHPSLPGGPPAPAVPFGDGTAPSQPSPLAAALPFRHAREHMKESAATTALPMITPEDLRRMTQQGPPAPAAPPAGKGPMSAADRARAEQAKTVAFAMPPGFGEPAAPASPQAHYPNSSPPSPGAAAFTGPGHDVRPSVPHDVRASAAQAPLHAPAHASPVPTGGGPVSAKSTGHFGLSIEQYAALCAEVAVFSDRAEAIFAQYGLGVVKDRLTADAAWQDRLRADHALMARWQSLYLYYHEYYFRLLKR